MDDDARQKYHLHSQPKEYKISDKKIKISVKVLKYPVLMGLSLVYRWRFKIAYS